MKNGKRQREGQRENVRESLQSVVDRQADDITRLTDDLNAMEDAAHEAEAEVKRLRQGIWDAYAELGFDTDGSATPDALVSDIVTLIVEAAKEFRKDYDTAIQCVKDEVGENVPAEIIGERA